MASLVLVTAKRTLCRFSETLWQTDRVGVVVHDPYHRFCVFPLLDRKVRSAIGDDNGAVRRLEVIFGVLVDRYPLLARELSDRALRVQVRLGL